MLFHHKQLHYAYLCITTLICLYFGGRKLQSLASAAEVGYAVKAAAKQSGARVSVNQRGTGSAKVLPEPNGVASAAAESQASTVLGPPSHPRP